MIRIASRIQKLTLALAAAAVLLGAQQSARAAFVLVEDFNALTTGAVNSQNGWTADSATVDVIDTAPASAADKALQNGDNSTEAYKTTPTIANNSTGTVFFQFNASNLSSGQSFGIADSSIDVDGGSVFLNYRAQLALTGTGGFTARSGGSSETIDSVSLSTDTWYSIWMVVNNTANTFQAWIQGGSIASQTQLAAGSTSTFNFRNQEPGSADLTNFLFARGGGGTGDSVAIDNIYVDNAESNLDNPIATVIPGPAALPAGLALLGLAAIKRRRA
jgi:hypothetical protein